MNSSPIQNLLNRIDPHSDFAAKHDTFVAEALETSGTYQTDGADTFVIDLHGIRVTANSEASAHALWLRAASTKIDRQGGAA
tara:strand:- start:232 stop:477 length:246 start_codon:yes stop_codon:yes gene_type:complete